MKVIVPLMAFTLLIFYMRHSQRQADAVRAELAELKQLMLKASAEASSPPAKASVAPSPLSPAALDFTRSPSPQPLLVRAVNDPPRTLMLSSKSGSVFVNRDILPPPSPSESATLLSQLNDSLVTLNPIRDKNYSAIPAPRTFIGGSKSLSVAPAQLVSPLQWLFDLTSPPPKPGESSQVGDLDKIHTGLTPEDLKRLSPPTSTSATPAVTPLAAP